MPSDVSPRSLLFVPGDSREKLAKAKQLPADALVVDWEDAVAPEHKGEARTLTIEFMRQRDTLLPAIFVRMNPVASREFMHDCEAIGQCAVDGIILSKCRSAADVLVLEEVLNQLGELGKCHIYPLIESPGALMNSFFIATASDRVAGLAFGAEDFSAEMGIVRGETEIELLYARSSLVTHARAAGRDAVDSPCLDFRSPERVREAGRRACSLGFTGKFAIHPSQVEILNEVFSPSKLELEEARRIVAAASPSTGVFSLEGSMVDEAILKRARRVLRFSSRRPNSVGHPFA